MKILHVSPAYLPAYLYGGPILSVHGLCEALVRKGHEVSVVTTNSNGPRQLDVPLGKPVDIDGVKVYYFNTDFLKRIHYAPALQKKAKELMGDLSIIHIHCMFSWTTSTVAKMAHQTKTPYVLSPRGMLVKDMIRKKSYLPKKLWINVFGFETIKQADAVHVTSELEAEELKKLKLRHPRIYSIPNGIDLEEIKRQEEGKVDPLVQKICENDNFILFLGRINWKKGLDRLIPALNFFPDTSLVIAGNSEGNYIHKIKKLVHLHKVSNRVFYTDYVNHANKIALLRSAKMLVLPSYSENFGNVVLEAMALGCPVMITPEVGLAKVVHESGSGLVVPGDSKTFGTALKNILPAANKLRDMGQNGIEVVQNQFTWDKVSGQVEEMYDEILNKKLCGGTRKFCRVSAVVLTYNEEINISRCLKSLTWCDDVIVIDSFSQDKTEKICRERGVRFYQRTFDNFETQRNWAISNVDTKYDWILFLDADEQVPPELAVEIQKKTNSVSEDIGAFSLARKFYFWNHWLRYCSLYPTWVVRLIHKRKVRYVECGHAEQAIVDGAIERLNHPLIDQNMKNIEAWFERHNRYSSKEAQYYSQENICTAESIRAIFTNNALLRQRALKQLSAKLPLRPILYFLYSYIWRRGFLDGKDGFIFCLMKSVYICMIDIKKYNLQRSKSQTNLRGEALR